MGILNVTPDSFSDGGAFYNLDSALAHAHRLIKEGADIIDIGGESARPGAAELPLEEELKRVLPIIRAIHQESNISISIDTYKPEVMCAAVAAGANLINDIYALQKPNALQAAYECQVPICLMHMQGKPAIMQNQPRYVNIMQEIKAFFRERISACEQAGIARESLIIDPGFGFGKTVEHNVFMTKHLLELSEFDLPILFGASRKSTIGALLNKPENERLYGSIAAAVLAFTNGARIIRTHDVAATRDALIVANAIKNSDQ